MLNTDDENQYISQNLDIGKLDTSNFFNVTVITDKQ